MRTMQYLPAAVVGTAFLLIVAVVLFFWFFATRGVPLAVLEPVGTPSPDDIGLATTVLGTRLKLLGAQSSAIGNMTGNRFTVSATVPADADKTVIRRALTPPGVLEILPAMEAAEPGDTDEALSKALQGAECTSSHLFLECQGYMEGKRRTWKLDRGTNGIEDFVVADAQPRKTAKGDWELSLKLTVEGTRQLGEFTREHVGTIIGIVLDDRVLTAARIGAAVEDGILLIAMDHRDPADEQERNARALAAVLRVQPMPFAFKDVTDIPR